MPRVARIVIPNVIQRGNNRQDVFFSTDDCRVYLELLRERCAATLAHAVGRTHFNHARYVNRLHGRSGHFWQGRFYSCPLDDTHLWTALAYIERNPVRAKLTRRAWLWPWGSASAHASEATDPPHTRAADPTGVRATDSAGVSNFTTDLLDLKAWRADWTARWRRQLEQPADDAWRQRFWRAANTGRPLAEDHWLARLESRLGRRLRANPIGRPRKRREEC